MMAALAELAKMGLQLLGALLVARLTVDWALSRYKRERSWDRETDALAELMVAISRLRRLLRGWLDDFERDPQGEDPHAEERIAGFVEARQTLRRVGAVATLLLADEVTLTLDLLESQLNTELQAGHEAETLRSDIASLDQAQSALVAFAKQRRLEARR